MIEARMVVRKRFVSADRQITRHLGRNCLDAATELKDEIRRRISTPGYELVIPKGATAGTRTRRRANRAHSRPGQYPFEQTGDLKGSFSAFLDRYASRGMTAYVSSDSEYLLALEFGRPAINLAPRPHVRRTLIDHRAALARLMLRPL